MKGMNKESQLLCQGPKWRAAESARSLCSSVSCIPALQSSHLIAFKRKSLFESHPATPDSSSPFLLPLILWRSACPLARRSAVHTIEHRKDLAILWERERERIQKPLLSTFATLVVSHSVVASGLRLPLLHSKCVLSNDSSSEPDCLEGWGIRVSCS